ncbi:hypothetical protein NNJEOMEG_01000 [Fundidesulfovibrio magnetotacticus]|uniref:Peptidase M15C domain-containing protein n=1 Tax=Fundidesulfovibrio magnetotacticus TaxID=2730080 RepID=A0A6V8LSW2_9BACT|nr:M15 family metallopeptidase [Fundidesulfovibrio magnetotacticus]GFK93169.1 hypothetical protein NNJEOMEG_01000 [Fundidesulfovibrio magnetotacticus]
MSLRPAIRLCLLLLLAAAPALAGPREDLELLRRGYPDAVRSVEQDGLVLSDGVRLPYDDGRAKDAEQALDAPDLEDMLAQPYPLERVTAEPAPGIHPGRRRVTALFKAAYGHTAQEVKAALVPVTFLGHRVLFNGRNGAAQALERVDRDLSAWLAAHPEARGRLLPLSGTFAWRPIAGTERLSMHSFGAAIDLNSKVNGYWRWSGRGDPLAQRTAFPAEAVEIFERHGFVWGGKWAEYDIMHFEYRPELITKAREAR